MSAVHKILAVFHNICSYIFVNKIYGFTNVSMLKHLLI